MTIHHKSRWLLAIAFAMHCAVAAAQGYPNRPVRLIVGFTPGGGVPPR